MGKNVGVVLGLASKCAIQTAERRGLTGSPLIQLPLTSESKGESKARLQTEKKLTEVLKRVPEAV